MHFLSCLSNFFLLNFNFLLSPLCVNELSNKCQQIIGSYINNIENDPVDDVNLNDVKEVISFFRKPLWDLPSLKDYKILLKESELNIILINTNHILNIIIFKIIKKIKKINKKKKQKQKKKK